MNASSSTSEATGGRAQRGQLRLPPQPRGGTGFGKCHGDSRGGLPLCGGHRPRMLLRHGALNLWSLCSAKNHSKLVEILQRTIKDDAIISLIHRYLNAGVMIGTMQEQATIGRAEEPPYAEPLVRWCERTSEHEKRRTPLISVHLLLDFYTFCTLKIYTSMDFKRKGYRFLEA